MVCGGLQRHRSGLCLREVLALLLSRHFLIMIGATRGPWGNLRERW